MGHLRWQSLNEKGSTVQGSPFYEGINAYYFFLSVGGYNLSVIKVCLNQIIITPKDTAFSNESIVYAARNLIYA